MPESFCKADPQSHLLCTSGKTEISPETICFTEEEEKLWARRVPWLHQDQLQMEVFASVSGEGCAKSPQVCDMDSSVRTLEEAVHPNGMYNSTKTP